MNVIREYLQFRIKSKPAKGFRIHSPFVYKLASKVIYPSIKEKKGLREIEKSRRDLLHNNQVIAIQDFGAGSRKDNKPERKISGVAGSSLKKAKDCMLLYNLAKYFKPETIVELGTSMGLTTLYLSKAAPLSRIFTLEGCTEQIKIASSLFNKHQAKNIEIKDGNFDQTLPEILQEVQSTDFVFFDGNHKKAATLDYFEQCLCKEKNHSVFIFDDIRWSKEMKETWERIIHHKRVTVSIDLFHMGLVFFCKECSKQNFMIRF